MTELVLVRHGETAGNQRKNYIGRTDEPLSADGEVKIRNLAAKGLYPAVDMLVVSPMLRCRQTAALIYPEMPQITVADLTECDFGEFENKNYRDLSDNADYQAWIDSGGVAAFPGGESRADFVARVCRGFAVTMAEILSADVKSAAFVVHGGTIMAILSSFADGGYYDYMTQNGGGWLVQVDANLWQKKCLGSVTPLF